MAVGSSAASHFGKRNGPATRPVLQSRRHGQGISPACAGVWHDAPVVPDRDPTRLYRRASRGTGATIAVCHAADQYPRPHRHIPRRGGRASAGCPSRPRPGITSAYYGEVLRAGIESIGFGQWEAARSTGLSASDTFVFVILPQALRNVLPDLVSNTVEVVKLTSIASVVSMTELLYSADMARSVTFNASPVVLAGLFYLVLLWPAVRLAARLEHRVGI